MPEFFFFFSQITEGGGEGREKEKLQLKAVINVKETKHYGTCLKKK